MDLRYKVKYMTIVIGWINNSCMLMQIQHSVNQNSVLPGNLPAVVTPILYELYQKKRDYDEFCCRSLSQSHLAGVAHHLLPDQPQVPRSDQITKLHRCRFCCQLGHIIKSCYNFHTNGDRLLQNDHENRKCCYSTEYHFPNPPSNEYPAAANILQKQPVHKFRS